MFWHYKGLHFEKFTNAKACILDCPTWDTSHANYTKLVDMFDVPGIGEYKHSQELYL